jgi:hypothetical protein
MSTTSCPGTRTHQPRAGDASGGWWRHRRVGLSGSSSIPACSFAPSSPPAALQLASTSSGSGRIRAGGLPASARGAGRRPPAPEVP